MTKPIVAGLAGIAVLAAGLVFAQAGPGRGRGHALGDPIGPMMMGPQMNGRILERLAEYLELTEAQKTAAKQLFEAARAKAEPDVKALAEARRQIAETVRSEATPAQVETHVQGVVQANTAAAQRLVVLHARTMSEFLNLLTPEQRDKAEKLRRLFGPLHGPRGPREQ